MFRQKPQPKTNARSAILILLIIFYNTEMNFYLRVSHEETRGKFLGIVLNDDGVYDELLETNIEINSWKQIYLRADVNFVDLQFWASFDGENWQKIGGVLNLGKLSEDYGKFFHFTGTFVGICCQDLENKTAYADFDYFEITEKS